jgi:CrcB protein
VPDVSIYLWIAIGSGFGGVARLGCSDLMTRWLGPQFPWGTLLVNVVGSFVIGYVAAFAGTASPLGEPRMAVFLMVGVCGGYTTFSAFSLQTMALAHQGAWARAGLNIVGSVVLCAGAVVLGRLAAGVA